jgi:hypothetical protein
MRPSISLAGDSLLVVAVFFFMACAYADGSIPATCFLFRDGR